MSDDVQWWPWHLAVEITATGRQQQVVLEKAYTPDASVQASGSSVTNLYYPLYKLNIAGGWAAARGVKKRHTLGVGLL